MKFLTKALFVDWQGIANVPTETLIIVCATIVVLAVITLIWFLCG